jgi:hypothetical protein
MDGSTPHPRPKSSGDGSLENALEGSFDLLCRFVEHLMVTNGAETCQSESTTARVDWELIRASVAGSPSVEHAIGRAAVIADRMIRGALENATALIALPEPNEDPFFAFSVADAVPDFGDNSRYREWVIRRVGRLSRLAR